ncbi:MAG: 3-keto-disaccharide hydrolase, partial [Candidatus Aminicenantales bacterium]
LVKKPGEWNRFTITCMGKRITAELNGEEVTDMDMSLWTSAKTNPDGSEIPPWLSRPFAELATKGRIGFQGKHAGAPIFFRNIRIKDAK